MSIRDLIFGNKKVEVSFHLPEKADIYYLIYGQRFCMDQDQYEQIKDIIEGEGYDLFYLPEVLHGLDSEVMKYNFPGVMLDFTHNDFSLSVAKNLEIDFGEHSVCLVWYDEDLGGFKHSEIKDNFEEFHAQVCDMFNSVLVDLYYDIRFRTVDTDNIEMCCSSCMDESLPCMQVEESSELDMLAAEAKDVIERLLLSGFSAEVIKGWLETKVKLSRMRITKRYKILLVDYDIEVKMGPLPKTVFLFFLRHPEGLRFVDLPDYKQEIYEIYSRLAVSDDLDKIQRSVDLLTDPFDNSINEKCTMIKYAFQKVVADDIASNYYVSGRQGHIMKIPLDRSMVEWE